MLRTLLTILKDFFFIPIPGNYKEEFDIATSRTNIAKANVISMTFIILEVIMIVASFIVKKGNFLKTPDVYYFAMYVSLIIAMAIFWRVFVSLGKDVEKHKRSITFVGICFTSFLLFWCAGISLLDQLSYGQIIIYSTAMISIAVVPLFPPLIFSIIYVAAQVFFVIGLPYFQPSTKIPFENIVNSTLFMLLSFIIARIRYKTWVDDFTNMKIIQQKGEEIENINIELKELNQKLEKLSQTDGLTDVSNRSMFDKMLKMEWNRCRRQSMPLSLLMIDIDHFKEINDNYGHQAGDNCIRELAKVLLSFVKRSSESVSRYGGDEFAIILPNIENKKALELADLLKTSVREAAIMPAYSCTSEYVTISIGIATVIPSDASSVNELIHTADKALYKTKKNRHI